MARSATTRPPQGTGDNGGAGGAFTGRVDNGGVRASTRDPETQLSTGSPRKPVKQQWLPGLFSSQSNTFMQNLAAGNNPNFSPYGTPPIFERTGGNPFDRGRIQGSVQDKQVNAPPAPTGEQYEGPLSNHGPLGNGLVTNQAMATTNPLLAVSQNATPPNNGFLPEPSVPQTNYGAHPMHPLMMMQGPPLMSPELQMALQQQSNRFPVGGPTGGAIGAGATPPGPGAPLAPSNPFPVGGPTLGNQGLSGGFQQQPEGQIEGGERNNAAGFIPYGGGGYGTPGSYSGGFAPGSGGWVGENPAAVMPDWQKRNLWELLKSGMVPGLP